MEIAVISDLHLGRGDRIDPFQGRDAELIRFLNHLERSFERVILLGDIFETLTGTGWGNPREEFMACRSAHPEVARRFLSVPHTYVHGNHDWVAGLLIGAPSELSCKRTACACCSFMAIRTTGSSAGRGARPNFCVSEAISSGWAWQRLHCLFAAADRAFRGASAVPDRCRFQRWALRGGRRPRLRCGDHRPYAHLPR